MVEFIGLIIIGKLKIISPSIVMIRSGVAQLTVFISLAEVFLGVVGTSAKLHIVGLHAGKRSAGSEIGSDEKI